MKIYLNKWYLYLLVTVISVVGFCLAVTFKTNPSKTEKVNFFLGTYDAKASKLDEKLESMKLSSIKQINITFSYYGSSSFSYVFQTTREEMDFYILPISFVNGDENLANHFSILDTNYLDNYFNLTLNYLSLKEKTRGIKIYDHESKQGFFKDYVTYESDTNEEDFYIFFNYKSPNFDKINNGQTSHALYIIKLMLNL